MIGWSADMRLILDLQAAQGESRRRGIGRQALALAKALLRNPRNHEVNVVLSSLFPESVETLREAFKGLLPANRIHVLELEGPVAWDHPGCQSRRARAEKKREEQLAALNPDRVHLASLFEGLHDDSVTTLSSDQNGGLTSATLHDLMPLIYPNYFLTDPAEKKWYEGKLPYLQRADLLLAVSESSRKEGLEHLQLPESRIVNISSAADNCFQKNSYTLLEEKCLRHRYGLSKPFIMFSGGDSPQKNIAELIRAYAALPLAVQSGYQLAIVCSIDGERRLQLRALAESLGMAEGDLVFTGYVSDENLIAFYNLCAAFVFPSWHEGFGLPVLEAMCCGAPVIAAHNTSLPEVVGWGEALFDLKKPGDLAAKLYQILTDLKFRKALVEHAGLQTKKFSWEKTAAAAWDAFEERDLAPKKNTPKCSVGSGWQPTFDKEILTKAEKISLLPPFLRPGVEYGTQATPSIGAFLGCGWSNLEKTGVWSDEQKSHLLLNWDPELSGSYELILKCQAFVNGRHPILKVRFWVNGQLQKVEWFHPLAKKRSIRLMLEPLPQDGLYRVEMDFDRARSPYALKMGRDRRTLGLQLASLQLRHSRKIDPRPGLLSRAVHQLLRIKGAPGRFFGSLPWPSFIRLDLRRIRRAHAHVLLTSGSSQEKEAFSVVISTLNRSSLLRETLESLRLQHYPRIEVVVVNGPSTDGTAELLREWKGRIKTADCPAANLAMSRNIGIAMSAGEFVVFLDDDAIPQPEWLSQMREGFDHETVAAVGGKVLHGSGETYQYEYACSDRLGRSNWQLTKPCPEHNFPGSYLFPYLQGTNAAFRYQTLLELGGFDEAFAYFLDETELCLRLNDAGHVIRQLPKALVRHKNASSGLRTAHIIRDHSPLLRSKIYFSNRHGRSYHRQEEIDEENHAFVQDHRHGVALLVKDGLMTQTEADLFEARASQCYQQAMESAQKSPLLLTQDLLRRSQAAYLSFT
jgi:glycosyltransferase involved in cell wall biosynthesis/GT2 family glycosyltransferase